MWINYNFSKLKHFGNLKVTFDFLSGNIKFFFKSIL